MYELSNFQNNRLLKSLDFEDSVRWSAKLTRIDLLQDQVLHKSGSVPEYLYFPITAIISLLHAMEDGESMELAMIGIEGMAGLTLIKQSGKALTSAVVLHGGVALRMPAWWVQQELNRDSIRKVILQYIQESSIRIAQIAACSHHHAIEQQLCRWLLTFHDRMNSNHLPITHGIIAAMLGVRRESVSMAAHKLHNEGLITCARGYIDVVNRQTIEQRCCECYNVLRQHTHLRSLSLRAVV